MDSGSECRDLPGFVVINGGLTPPGGADCFGSGFLPASYQGSTFRAEGAPVANIVPLEKSSLAQRRKLALIRSLDGQTVDRVGHHDALDASIANYELAFKMQTAVPGPNGPERRSRAPPGNFTALKKTMPRPGSLGGNAWWLARLVERGVRFIELLCPQRRDRPLGSARQPQGWPRAQKRPGCRSARSPASWPT